MILQLRHVGIVVRNLTKSLYFYQQLLGLKIHKEMVEESSFIDAILGLKDIKVKTVKLQIPKSSIIELLYYFSPTSPKINARKIHETGITHFALTVKDLDKEYHRLKKAAIKFVSCPQKSPDGLAKVAFCKDPDGNYIELVEAL